MTDMEETENTSNTGEENEDILELTDIIRDDGDAGSGTALADIPDETGDESAGEDIIELTDIVEKEKTEAAQENAAVLELTDIAEENQPGIGAAGKKDQKTVVEGTGADSGIDDDTGIDLDLENSGLQPGAGSPDIDADSIEAALEKVIEKKFGSKIESLLFEVMEKVMVKEINEIKDTLQKDLNSIGKI